MTPPLTSERRDEVVNLIAERIGTSFGRTLRGPLILLLEMHAPLAFLGSQILLAAQPFLGLMTGDKLARDLAFLLEEPANVQQLIARLEKQDSDADIRGRN
jgi:hypothetical protein